jgi:hypothetical protein
VCHAFQAADVPVQLLQGWPSCGNQEGPLLVLYPPPDLALAPELLEGPAGLSGHYQDLLAAVAVRAAAAEAGDLRLVNLALSSIPALIAWGVARLQGHGPSAASVQQDPWSVLRPDPLAALISLDLIRSDASLLPAYLAVEAHPLAADADGRPPDRGYPERLQSAAAPPLLLRQHQSVAQATADLRQLGEQLGAARAELIDAAWIRQQLSEQLQQMQAALAELEVVRAEAEQLQRELDSERTEGLANRQMIQSTLEQAVQVSRHQSAMQDLASQVISGLQRQLSRTAGG